MLAAAALAVVTPGATAAAASPAGAVQAWDDDVVYPEDLPSADDTDVPQLPPSEPPAVDVPASDPSGTPAPDTSLSTPTGVPATPSTAQVEQYLRFVTGNLDSVWAAWFQSQGFPRPDTAIRLIGPGESFTTTCADENGTHPVVTTDYDNLFYCSTDSGTGADGGPAVGGIALPVGTLQRMWTGDILGVNSGVPGDFAAAIAVAHEFGHSVVDELSTDEGRAAPVGKNSELIADCFAGVWAARVQDQGLLEAGDINEAVAALQVVGDTGISANPHGTSAERVRAMRSGFSSDNPTTCTSTYWAA